MKIASFKKARETFDIEIVDDNGEESVFTLLPLPADLVQVVTIFLNGGKELLSQSQKLRYIQECIVGWKGVKDEDGEEVKFTKSVANQLIQSDYDDLLTALIVSSFSKRIEKQEKLEEDKENLGKSQTK